MTEGQIDRVTDEGGDWSTGREREMTEGQIDRVTDEGGDWSTGRERNDRRADRQSDR